MKPEIRNFCLACLGTKFYMATLDLIDGAEAWVHMCVECNIRMEYSGTDMGQISSKISRIIKSSILA